MESALIGASGEKTLETLCRLTRAACHGVEPVVAGSGAQVRRLLAGRHFDFVVLSMPLSDEPGIDLAAWAAGELGAGVLLLVKAEHAEEISRRLEEYGVFVLERPVTPNFFASALRLVRASVRRAKGLEKEKMRLQGKIDEIHLMNRAKLTLIQYLGLTEQQAHRHMEKQAMDLRIPKTQVAESILKTYEP